jgi:RimJ/RimL family protein N-acetyltransferase
MNESLKERVLTTISRLKQPGAARDGSLAVHMGGGVPARLVPITWEDVDRPDSIELLARWRETAADAFPSQFPVTLDGTKRWLIHGLLEVPDRLLFWVTTSLEKKRIGHVGVFHYDFDDGGFEIDNIVRGVEGALPGIIYHSLQELLTWNFNVLGMCSARLRVFAHNDRAIRLYQRLGFRETMRMPLVRVQERDVVRWVEANGTYGQPVGRYFVTMGLDRSDWWSARAA